MQLRAVFASQAVSGTSARRFSWAWTISMITTWSSPVSSRTSASMSVSTAIDSSEAVSRNQTLGREAVTDYWLRFRDTSLRRTALHRRADRAKRRSYSFRFVRLVWLPRPRLPAGRVAAAREFSSQDQDIH